MIVFIPVTDLVIVMQINYYYLPTYQFISLFLMNRIIKQCQPQAAVINTSNKVARAMNVACYFNILTECSTFQILKIAHIDTE